MKKIVLPGILAGLAVFVWSFISHMVLPLGEIGVKAVGANEDVVLSAMKGTLTEPGGAQRGHCRAACGPDGGRGQQAGAGGEVTT
jgi:hypothetical protein